MNKVVKKNNIKKYLIENRKSKLEQKNKKTKMLIFYLNSRNIMTEIKR